jgi:hypothetical protein
MRTLIRNPNGSPAQDVVETLSAFRGSSEEAIKHFRSLSPLPEDSQRIIDEGVIRVGRQNLVLVNDLIEAGLTRPLANWLSVLEIGTDSLNEAGYAQRTMDLDVRGERQVLDRKRRIIPVFATHDDFSFGARELAAGERVGQPLDATHVEQATRNVNVAIEDQAINGWTDGDAVVKVHGNSVPGILTDPAHTSDFTGANPAWDHTSKTGAEIVTDVLNMIAVAKGVNKTGPFNLYVGTDYFSALNKNYIDGTTTFDQTILERLEKIQAGGRGIRIRELDLMPDDKAALIQMTSDVIDVVVGQQPAPLSWMSNNGFRRYFLVLACMITRVRQDYNGNTGIVIGQLP